MALDSEQGRRMLQLLTSRYDDRRWRKKIEKTLSLPVAGVSDEAQQAIFLYLKHGLKAYKSRRADPDSWIVGGYATREVIERAKFNPAAVGASITKEHVASLGVDPGPGVDEAWWEEMLVTWFEEPATEPSEAGDSEGGDEQAGTTAADAKIHKADA
jgi:hypothetical protein